MMTSCTRTQSMCNQVRDLPGMILTNKTHFPLILFFLLCLNYLLYVLYFISVEREFSAPFVETKHFLLYLILSSLHSPLLREGVCYCLGLRENSILFMKYFSYIFCQLFFHFIIIAITELYYYVFFFCRKTVRKI